MKAIIVAAGRGRRLGPGDRGDPQVHGARWAGGRSCTASWTRWRGRRRRRRDRARLPGRSHRARGGGGRQAAAPVRFVENPDWANNNILDVAALRRARDGRAASCSRTPTSCSRPSTRGAWPPRRADVALIVDRPLAGHVRRPRAPPGVRGGAGRGSRRPATDRASIASASAWCRPSRRPASSSAWRGSRPPARRRCARVWARARARGMEHAVRPGGDAAPGVSVGCAERDGRRRRRADAAVHRRALARDRHRGRSLARARAGRRLGDERAMPGPDPAHWLHRLTADEWLAAAATELELCAETLERRAFRPGVTHARRAAGMAWNAVLVAGRRGTEPTAAATWSTSSRWRRTPARPTTCAPPPSCCATRRRCRPS